MSDSKNDVVEGLEVNEAANTTEEKKPRAKKVQTPEDKETLAAGVEQIKEIGVSENLAKVLELIPEWNAGDKEGLSALKDSVIEAFGGSDKLKDYITDGEFKNEIQAFNGIAKAMPVLNNIKAFYERRKGTGRGRVKTVQIAIDGTTYNVNAAYREEIKDMPKDTRKELLLGHVDTKKAEIEELI